MKPIQALLAALLLAGAGLASAADAPGRSMAEAERERARGWFWYDDPPPERAKKAPEKKTQRPTPAPEGEKSDVTRRFEAFQERVKESRMRFFLDPSPENARAMAEIQTAMVSRASEAADVWQRTIWANPQFDFTQERPVTQIALGARDEERKLSRARLFEQVAASQVLYFFFRSDCPYCHAFAPVLAAFSQASGIRVFAVSLDGTGLPEYPNPARDNGIAQTLQISTVPALFLADPAKARISPVGYGVMSQSDLVERIEAIADPQSSALRAATPSQSLQSMETLQ